MYNQEHINAKNIKERTTSYVHECHLNLFYDIFEYLMPIITYADIKHSGAFHKALQLFLTCRYCAK